MNRGLLNSLMALSLLAFVAMVGLWVHSYWMYDAVWHCGRMSRDARCFGADSFRGDVTLYLYRRDDRAAPAGLYWDRAAATRVGAA